MKQNCCEILNEIASTHHTIFMQNLEVVHATKLVDKHVVDTPVQEFVPRKLVSIEKKHTDS